MEEIPDAQTKESHLESSGNCVVDPGIYIS